MSSPDNQQSLVTSFLEIAVGQTPETARQFLQATSWKLEDAIQLFFIGGGGEGGGMIPSSAHTQPVPAIDRGNEMIPNNGMDEVRAPLPVVRETLYGDHMYFGATRTGHPLPDPHSMIAFRNFSEEAPKSPGVWEADEGASSANASASASAASESSVAAPHDSLASLYRPPFHLMFHGSFEKAKATSSSQDKWLLVNIQSTTEFTSHMLNRDTWANDAVSQTIKANFIFWQVYDDTTEGRKVCTYYKLDSIPVVLVIDPTTGQKMKMWCGMIEPEMLLEDLVPYLDGGPHEHFATLSKKRPRGGSFSLNPHTKPKEESKDVDEEELQRALAASLEDNSMKEDEVAVEAVVTSAVVLPTFPPLSEEPKGGDRNVQCRVGIRLPNGQRVQRNFLKTDPIQLLWSFCYTQLEESERTKPFKLMQAIPGESRILEYESNLTLEQSGVANSMISATWE